jgi:glycosyltransferase involved in cell wall biosynthesis
LNSFLFLSGIFQESTITFFESHSAATNQWLLNFEASLRLAGNTTAVVGYPEERLWPFGRFRVHKSSAMLPIGVEGSSVAYINVPFIRNYSKNSSLKSAAVKVVANSKKKYEYTVTFSCINHNKEILPCFNVAKFLRNKYGIGWICIVGDGPPPMGADIYLYHNWTNFLKHDLAHGRAIHIDGGVSDFLIPEVKTTAANRKIFLYSGALSSHGGAIELVDEFLKVNDDSCQLWLTGRGANAEFESKVSGSNRIKLLGFLAESELITIANKVDFFINPRPISFLPNLHNFPSKLFFYLAFEKPILSTFTPGISPEYEEVLIKLKDSAWSESIEEVLKYSVDEIQSISHKIKKFKIDHSWNSQARKFCNFLQTNQS